MTEIEKTREFAVQAHGDQTYGRDKPYVVHLDDVYHVLCMFGYTDFSIGEAAYLHDVVEDCGVTVEDLAKQFGSYVARIVDFCTDEPGSCRREKKATTYARMRATLDTAGVSIPAWLKDAVRVKVADRLANVLASLRGDKPDLIRMYRKEREIFKAVLYVPGLCDAMWAEYDQILLDS